MLVYSSGTTEPGQTTLRNPPPAPDQLVKRRLMMARAHKRHPLPEKRRGTSPYVPDAFRPGSKRVLVERSSNSVMKGRDWVAVHRGLAWSSTDAATNAAYSCRSMDYDLAASRRLNREPAWLPMVLAELWGEDGAGFPIKSGFVRMLNRLIEVEREGFIALEVSLPQMAALCGVSMRTIQRWNHLCESRGILEINQGWQKSPNGYTRTHRVYGKLSYRLGGDFVRRVGLALHEDVPGEFPSGGNFRAATKCAAVAIRKEARAHMDAIRDRNWSDSRPHTQRKKRTPPPILHLDMGSGLTEQVQETGPPGTRGGPKREFNKARPLAGSVMASPDLGNREVAPGNLGLRGPNRETQPGKQALRVDGVSDAWQEELRKSTSPFAAAFLAAQTTRLLVFLFCLLSAFPAAAETIVRGKCDHDTRRINWSGAGCGARGGPRNSDAERGTPAADHGDWWQRRSGRIARDGGYSRGVNPADDSGGDPNTGRHVAGLVEPKTRIETMTDEMNNESVVPPPVWALEPTKLDNGSTRYAAKVPAASRDERQPHVLFGMELEERHCVNVTAVSGWIGKSRVHVPVLEVVTGGDVVRNVPRYLVGPVQFKIGFGPKVEFVEFSVTMRPAPVVDVLLSAAAVDGSKLPTAPTVENADGRPMAKIGGGEFSDAERVEEAPEPLIGEAHDDGKPSESVPGPDLGAENRADGAWSEGDQAGDAGHKET